jgi:DNA-binding MarR family transcriptional regulator
VTLTATGTRLLTRLRRAAEEAEERLLTPLTTTERRTLHALLTKLFAAGGAV